MWPSGGKGGDPALKRHEENKIDPSELFCFLIVWESGGLQYHHWNEWGTVLQGRMQNFSVEEALRTSSDEEGTEPWWRYGGLKLRKMLSLRLKNVTFWETNCPFYWCSIAYLTISWGLWGEHTSLKYVYGCWWWWWWSRVHWRRISRLTLKCRSANRRWCRSPTSAARWRRATSWIWCLVVSTMRLKSMKMTSWLRRLLTPSNATFINLLVSRDNYSATSNNTKLVHWPLMGGLFRLIQRRGDWAGPEPAHAPPRLTKCNSPPINGQCINHCIAV